MAEDSEKNTEAPDDAEAASSGPSLPEAKPPGYFEGESMTRRTLFTVGSQALGGAAGGIVALSAVGFAVATPIFDRPEEIWQAVGDPDAFSSDSYRAVVTTIVRGIGEAGKTTVYVRKGNPSLEPVEGAERESAGEYVAISTRCAHLGCPVRYVEAAGSFICPCHGGVYGFQGEVIGGPPVRPLDRFQTRVRGGKIEVGPRFSVTSQLDPVRARDPGEFTGGIWEVLYPPRPSTPPAP